MKHDRDLQKDVLRALEYEQVLDASKIGVTVSQGVVTLQGRVKSYDQKTTADRVARAVFGVRALANDLEVVSQEWSAPSDTDIAQASLRALTGNADVPLNAIGLSVTNGWVTLTGEVTWPDQRAAAERSVRRLPGVRGVTNNIVVTRISPSNPLAVVP